MPSVITSVTNEVFDPDSLDLDAGKEILLDMLIGLERHEEIVPAYEYNAEDEILSSWYNLGLKDLPSADDMAAMRKLMDSQHSAVSDLFGAYPDYVKQLTSHFLEASGHSFGNIAMGRLPRLRYGAYAFASRDGRGAAIALNRGTGSTNERLARCFLAIVDDGMTKSGPSAYSSYALERAMDIIALAGIEAKSPLVHDFRWPYGSARTETGLYVKMHDVVGFMSIFLVLHEYAHLHLGHLSISGEEDTVVSLGRRRQQEFEADEFAAQVMLNILNPDFVALIAGLTINFLGLIERFGPDASSLVYPAGSRRWIKLKKYLQSNHALGTWKYYIDNIFIALNNMLTLQIPRQSKPFTLHVEFDSQLASLCKKRGMTSVNS